MVENGSPSMLNKFSLILLCAVAGFGHGASGRSVVHWKFRTMRVRVVDENGKCLPGAKVQLRGLDQDAIGAMSNRETSKLGQREKARKYQGWEFAADDHGEFTARFGRFREYDCAQATGVERPGFGEFYFVAEKENSAGAVGPMIGNYSREETAFHKGEDDRYGEYSEWLHDGYNRRILDDRRSQGETLILRFQRGLDLSGRLINEQEQPIPGAALRLFHDLHADTHTGHGAEIFERTVTTNASGRFLFRHVYPNTFYLDFDGPGYWIRTRVRRRWADGMADEITPQEDESSLDLLLIAAPGSPYHYQGRVTDQQGQPITGAKVSVHASLHSPSRTFEDDHDHSCGARTGPNGAYDLGADSPFVHSFTVEAPNFENKEESGDEDDFYSPGRYDFVMKRE